jgi:UDP-N-acetylmuramoyl-tripeptide--D-alanyl-D-alanine ligase
MQSYEHCIREVFPDVGIEGTIPEDTSFSIDSRTIKKDEIFVALKGERQDGHAFVQDALDRGAVGAVVARDKKEAFLRHISKDLLQSKVIITVSDPLHALISFATHWREQFSYPVIGVTGSVGKTSAKETIAKMFAAAGRSYIASHGNQNTQIGLALNLLRMREHHEVAVFELGINRRGEMAQLARMAKPTIGIITTIGHCHMEGLGSLQDIAAEKRDIFKYFTERDIGIVDGDQPLLSAISYFHPVIKVGYKTINQIQARKVRFVNIDTHCIMKIYKNKYEVVLSNPHAGTVHRALVTAAVGHILHIPHEHIIAAVQEPIAVAGRFERRMLSVGNGTVINDCYNANPESMRAALAAFQEIQTTACKVAVLGDMLELGVNSPFWHRQKVTSLKKLILVGNMVRCVENTVPLGIEIICVTTWQEALEMLPAVIGDREVMMLVKGSQGVGLSNLVAHCTK